MLYKVLRQESDPGTGENKNDAYHTVVGDGIAKYEYKNNIEYIFSWYIQVAGGSNIGSFKRL